MAGAVSQSVLQAATAGNGVSAVSQSLMLAAYAPPSTFAIRSTEFVAQAATEGRGVPAISHMTGLVAYRVQPTEDLDARAWEFTFDGHTFYVVTLGEQGTWVYDTSTGQWSQFETDGYSSWNMERGTTWKGQVIAADRENPIIWKLDPTSFIDNDFKSQTRVVTGGLAVRNRAFPSVNAFRLTASKGEFEVGNTAPPTEATVRLEYSDDQGKTFQDAGTVTIDTDLFQQEVSWLSLGSMEQPGRVFRVTDIGAVARIDGADAEIEGED